MTQELSHETLDGIRRHIRRGWANFAAPARERLSDWAERHFELDGDSSHRVGSWRCWSFQRGMMDWMSDDRIVRVVVRKSKRVGYTKLITALVCYYAAHLRRKVAMWQPTDDDRDSYVRTELEPVLDAIRVVREARRRGGKLDTLKLRQFVGAVVHMLGGKAARAYRRITVALAILDEWSAFDQSVEGLGDPGTLAFGRLEGAPFPKFVGGSTPGTLGACHVTLAASQADVDMRYHVECPHCGVEHPLTTGMGADGKRTRYGLQWPAGQPDRAVHVCPHCLQPMTQAQYLPAGEPMAGTWVCIRTGIRYEGAGRWTDAVGTEIRPPRNVAAQVWAIYSPQRTWSSIAEQHDAAQAALDAGDESLMISLVTETYGEAYERRGERTDGHALETRGDQHPRGVVPVGALVLTGGIDVQADRVELGVWGWAARWRSWAVDHVIVEGDPLRDASLWDALMMQLRRQWPQAWRGGCGMSMSRITIDSGYASHAVYDFVRRCQAEGLPVYAAAGSGDVRMPIKGPARPQDINWQGRRVPNGVKRWEIGTHASEDLLHGQLQIETPGPGHIAFAAGMGSEWYCQLTGKQRLPIKTPRGIEERWVRMRPRVEVRDCRRYAHHAALCLGIGDWSAERWRDLEHQVQPPQDLFAALLDDDDDRAEMPGPVPVPADLPMPAAIARRPPQPPRVPRIFGGR